MCSVLRIPFSEDLINAALEQAADHTTLVFPTKVSAARARQRWLECWQLEDCEFLSMDELKVNLLLPDKPAVSDDKRLLCLYQSLSPDDRDNFHINGYFDIVDWGQHFLQFFAELCDERVDPQILRDLQNHPQITLLDWQTEYLLRIMDIRDRYRQKLEALGFDDPIFSREAENIRVSFTGRRLVFVNQYYYSRLALAMLEALREPGNDLVALVQATAGAPQSL